MKPSLEMRPMASSNRNAAPSVYPSKSNELLALRDSVSDHSISRVGTNGKRMILSMACSLLAVCSAQSAVIFSFEEDESWRPSFNNASVSNAEAKDGSWSLAVKPGGASYSSPSTAMIEEEYAGISLSMMASDLPASGRTFARFRILIGNELAGVTNPTSTLEFYLTRQTAVNYRLQYREFDGVTVTQKTLDLGSAFDPTSWNDISVILSEDKRSYALDVNGIRIEGISLTSDATDNDVITRVQFYNVASTDFSGTVYYDRIATIPEPSIASSLVLAGGTAFGIQCLRRKGKGTKRAD